MAIPIAVALTALAARAASAQTHFVVTPNATDPNIGAAPGTGQFNNAAYHLHVPLSPGPSPKLVIFLHGAGGVPFGYTGFLQVAAEQGYYVIGLSYPDVGLVGAVCGNQISGPDCCGEPPSSPRAAASIAWSWSPGEATATTIPTRPSSWRTG